jgi:hypothetical protein
MFIYNGTEYPRFIGDIQIMHPDYREGDPLPKGWEAVATEDYPELLDGHIIEELPVVKENGSWVRKWNQRPLTEQELEARSVRSQAIAKLQENGMSLEDAHKFVAQFIG